MKVKADKIEQKQEIQKRENSKKAGFFQNPAFHLKSIEFNENIFHERRCDMATVINNPPGNNGDGSGAAGTIIAVVVILLVVVLFFVYGLPRLRGTSTTQVNVPDHIDVNTGGQ